MIMIPQHEVWVVITIPIQESLRFIYFANDMSHHLGCFTITLPNEIHTILRADNKGKRNN